MKKSIIAVLLIVLIGGSLYYFFNNAAKNNLDLTKKDTTNVVIDQNNNASTTDQVAEDKTKTVIGSSVQGNDLTAYHYGTGDTNVLFVGGIHGGYEWNTVSVAYQLMDYLEKTPDSIPANVRVTVIPVLNPDGLNKTVGTPGRFEASEVTTDNAKLVAGRFNANTVDLNRNFDCDWQKNGTWQNKTVSGGSAAFSEPESLAFKNYIENNKPAGVVVWYSSAGGVYSSSCHSGVLSETSDLTKAFAKASGYPAHEEFNFYEITGDAVNWLAKEKIPAISVLLTNHTDTEWTKNLAGIKAVFDYYAK